MEEPVQMPGDEARKQILIACPLTKTFLDDTLDNQDWLAKLDAQYRKVEQNVASAVGENVENIALIPLAVIMVDVNQIFTTDPRLRVPRIDQVLLVKSIIGMGFELGDKQKIGLFENFIRDELANRELLTTGENTSQTILIENSIGALLSMGNYYWMISKGLDTKLTDFIGGLDI